MTVDVPGPRAGLSALLLALLGAGGCEQQHVALELELVSQCSTFPAGLDAVALTLVDPGASSATQGCAAQSACFSRPSGELPAVDSLAGLQGALRQRGTLFSLSPGQQRSLLLRGYQGGPSGGCAALQQDATLWDQVAICGHWAGEVTDEDSTVTLQLSCPASGAAQAAGACLPVALAPACGPAAVQGPTLVEVGQGTGQSGTNASLTFQSPPDAGDLLVAAVFHGNAAVLSPPAGWTMAVQRPLGDTDVIASMFTLVAGPGAAASYSWTASAGTDIGVVGARYTGVDTDSPLVDQLASQVGASSLTAQTSGETPPTSPGAGLLVAAVFVRHYEPELAGRSWSNAFQERAVEQSPGGTHIAVVLADRVVTQAGSYETTLSWTVSGDVRASGMLLAFRGAPKSAP